MNRPQVVLVAGGSCSGKSEFTKWFKNAIVISLDSFYLPIEKLQKDKNGDLDFDTPQAIDINACTRIVKNLTAKKTVEIPTYSFLKNAVIGSKKVKLKKSTKYIVIEGLYTFFSPLLELGDMKIFLDTPPEARIARRMVRDVKRKGRTSIEIMTNFIHAERRYKELVEPTKKFADLVIPFSYNPVKF